jgi:hypothetical protein
MANITISELRPAGADLFSDSESYLMDLSGEELSLEGGLPLTVTTSSKVCIGGAVKATKWVAGAVATGAAAQAGANAWNKWGLW